MCRDQGFWEKEDTFEKMVMTDNTRTGGDRAAQMVFLLYLEQGFELLVERTKLLVGESTMYAICLSYASYSVTQVADWLTGMSCGTRSICMVRAHCRQAMGMALVCFAQLCGGLRAYCRPVVPLLAA